VHTASAVVVETRPGALPESTSETVLCETPARRATSTLVILRDRAEGAPVTGRGLRGLGAMDGSHHAAPSGAAAPLVTGDSRSYVIRSTLVRMTPPHLHRSSSMLARSALLALVLAGGAGAVASSQERDASTSQRTAVLAGADAPPAAVAAASHRATGTATIRRADGALDAQAQATRLAAEGYDTVIGVGAQARAAVTQAAAGEVGDGTGWQTAAR
jgi:hypothetical protein